MLWKGSAYELILTNVILKEELYYVGNDKSTKKKVLIEVVLVQEGEMNPFPLQGNQRSCGVMFTENVAVYCHCKQLYEPMRFMLECGRCSDWFHHSCEKVPKKSDG